MVTGIGIDVAVAILILISAVLAAARGFTRELLSLATWVGAAALAVFLYLSRPEAMAGKDPNPAQGLALQAHKLAQSLITDPTFAAIGLSLGAFLVALIVLHLLTMWIADLIVDSRIGPLDRTLGFVFGAARGLLIVVLLAIGANFLVGSQNPDYLAGSRTYQPLLAMGTWIEQRLPPDLLQMMNDFVNKKTDTETPNDTTPGDDTTPPADVGASSEQPSTAG